MQSYVIPIKYAIIIFPLIAFFFTIPYIIYLYRKYGSISPLRTIVVYSFILYLIVAYFLVILPLPERSEVAKYTTPIMQLIPFHFISDIIEKSSLVITDVNTFVPALKESYIYSALFNVILLIPFGIYLRYYFKFSIGKTVLFSFMLSLFFELTQLTGLYFIYPRPYRLFDVDDLITNTLGGSIGYLITPIFSFILPSREKLDLSSYKKGKNVSYLRRFIAFIIDFILINIITSLIVSIINIPYHITFIIILFINYLILIYLLKGQTIGKKIVKIKIVSQDDTKAKLYQYFLRYFFLFGLLYLPSLELYILNYNIKILTYITFVVIGIIFCILFFQMLLKILLGKKELFYEKISKTKNISTIEFDDEEQEEVDK